MCSCLRAINPAWAIGFFFDQPVHAFVMLSLIVLCITGAEALYADLGQFGRGAISLAWFVVVWPCLLLNYFGQGAWILEASRMHPGAARAVCGACSRPWRVKKNGSENGTASHRC